MSELLKTILKRVLVGGGVLVIALALLVGAIRLIIAQLPGYQDELKAWVTSELGIEADFAALDARLGLFGPELDLRDVRLRAVGMESRFLEARSASLTVDPWLLLRGRVGVSRLTVDGARIAIERAAGGVFRVQGLELGAAAGVDLAAVLPAASDVVIRDSEIRYADLARQRSWQLADVDLTLARGAQGLAVTARAIPSAALGRRVTLTAERPLGDDLLTATIGLEAFDLAALVQLLPTERDVTVGGAGEIEVVLRWRGGRFADAAVEAVVKELALDDADAATFERVALAADWTRVGDDGFDLAVRDLDVARSDRSWPAGSTASVRFADGRVGISAEFVRLEDVDPLVRQLAPAAWVERWTALAPRGDLDGLELDADIYGGTEGLAFETGFSGLSIEPQGAMPGFDGVDGELRAGDNAGTLRLSSSRATVTWPPYFDERIGGGALRGTVVWRRGQEGLRVLSDDLRFELFGEPLSANFDLELPADAAGPRLDLHGRLDRIAIETARTLLPEQLLPESVSSWLHAALHGGTATDVTMAFTGALASFPFDDGDGEFLVTADVADLVIEPIEGWPAAEDLVGNVRFRNAGFLADGSGRVIGSTTDDIRVAIADMRDPLLEIDATLGGPLADVLEFVQTAPLIARHLGPGFDLLRAGAGAAVTTLDLDLPLLSFGDFVLASRLEIQGGNLAIDGFRPAATEISGVLDIMNSSVSGDGIAAVFLGGPVTASVRPATVDGYRTVVAVAGETTSDAVLDAFALPLRDLMDGQTLWSGRLLLPNTDAALPKPPRIEVESNLSGVALEFPAPLAKPPGEATSLRLAFEFAGDEALSIAGNLGATRRFEFLLDRRDQRFMLSRGVVAFGGEDPLLPLRDGIVVSGRVPALTLDDWLAVSKSSNIDRARPLFYSADLDIGDFAAFGQHLGETSLSVQRGDRVWDIGVESAAIAGRIEVPQNLRSRAPIIADMDRVYLTGGDVPTAATGLDPRTLPGLRLRAAEFGFGTRELGRLEADVVAEPMGLRLTSLTGSTSNYSLGASGSWLFDGTGSVSRIAATVTSVDVAATLDQLGIAPVVEGESGELTASIWWNGPPSSSWLDHLYGDVALRVDTGSMVEIDPGAGRVVGLMSIAALPRRLMLDFRDVFSKGFTFDEITGSFTIDDGNAYTDNLKLSGPAAEIGVIGRTGLRDRDYQQQAVVTAEPSNMLPTVGGLLGGPGVGAALLIFTRIFKEPLKGIGRASYCVTGSWDDPAVERITPDRAGAAETCAALPELMAETSDGG